MKKLMFLFIAIATFLLAFQVDAQVLRLSNNQLYGSYSGAAGDTALSTTAKTFDLYVAKGFMYYYDVQVKADSSGDGSDFTIQLQGSNDESNFYNEGSSQAWAVSSTDTIMRFTNYPSSETWTVAEHLRTTAAKEDQHAYDSATGVATTWVDTVTVSAAIQTVAAQTYTIAKQYPVGWRYLRVSFTGGAAGARMELNTITVAIRPSVFNF